MSFQKQVRYDQPFGIVGEIRFDGPVRAGAFTLATPDASVPTTNNIVGRAFTFIVGKPGMVTVGGAGTFAGIMANPKVYPYYGEFTGNDPKALYVPNGMVGEFVDMGFITVMVDKAANVGDLIAYDNTTGALTIVAKGGTAPTGKTLVPNATVDRYPQTATTGGPVLVRLTN